MNFFYPNRKDPVPQAQRPAAVKPPGGPRIGEMRGGAGGRGGEAKLESGKGGAGGGGGDARIPNDGGIVIDKFEGGIGGAGGIAPKDAGDGGAGGNALIENDEQALLHESRSPGPDMDIEKFGKKYSLHPSLVQMLSGKGYNTAGALRFTTVTDLKEDGFGKGHINQIKHAVDVWAGK